ncbi:MAG TPA: GNAT family N-acetyltransferase [Verrucomicrobiae bacterium]|nr:GNAT family N-acetyltransferase [Verrucomicrobiae bacterium]
MSSRESLYPCDGEMVDYSNVSWEDSLPDPIPLDNTALGVWPTTPLPKGFYYANAVAITCSELAKLQDSASGKNYADDIFSEHITHQSHGERLVGIGVRGMSDARLIGYGLLAIFPCRPEERRSGHLYDFVVHPSARHKGIGRAIIDERIAQSDTLGVERLKVTLEESNTLRPYYLEKGFRKYISTHTLIRVLSEVAQSGT